MEQIRLASGGRETTRLGYGCSSIMGALGHSQSLRLLEAAYDAGIREKAKAGKSGEALFMELALEDLRRAADEFRPMFDATDGFDGWVSMEVSPLLAQDTVVNTGTTRNVVSSRHPLQVLDLSAATNPSGSIIIVDAQLAPFVRQPFEDMKQFID